MALIFATILQGRPGRQGPQGAAGEKGSRVSDHSLVENLYTRDSLYILLLRGLTCKVA